MDKEKIEFLKQNREIVYSLTVGKLVSMRQLALMPHFLQKIINLFHKIFTSFVRVLM